MNATAPAAPCTLDLTHSRALVFDHIYDGVIVTTPDGVITDWNAGAERMFGWSRDEVLGRTPAFLHRVGEADTLTGDILAVLARHGRWVGEITFVRKDGSLGVLAGGIAHDFNNLLTGILGHSSLMIDDLPAASPLREQAEQIETIAIRAADLCKQMLAYSGKGRFVLRRLDLNELVEETARLLHVSISKKAAMRFRLRRPLPAVLGDATQLRQVVMNLVINASEALGDAGGSIEISSGFVRAGRACFSQAVLAPDLPEGDYVFLEVADSGCGMAPAIKARIFDPFYTTKFTGRGLGLAAVLGIVRGHGGALLVDSEPGRGTTFRVLLPRADGTVEAQNAQASTPPLRWPGGGRVLVVDDEEIVRRITTNLLQSLGFDAALASDGAEALSVFAQARGEFAFVMLDLTMPRMDGEETFQALLKLKPGTRVLLMSGFDESEAMPRFSGLGLAGFIQKPFNLATLREKLPQVLGLR